MAIQISCPTPCSVPPSNNLSPSMNWNNLCPLAECVLLKPRRRVELQVQFSLTLSSLVWHPHTNGVYSCRSPRKGILGKRERPTKHRDCMGIEGDTKAKRPRLRRPRLRSVTRNIRHARQTPEAPFLPSSFVSPPWPSVDLQCRGRIGEKGALLRLYVGPP